MAAPRPWRALGCVVLAAVAVGVLPGVSRPRAVPGLAAVQFDSVVVSPLRFSPNGDGSIDSVRINYQLPESTYVDLWIAPAGGTSPVRTFFHRVLQTGRPVVWWNGRDDNRQVVPDGDYTLHFEGTTVDSVRLQNQRQIQVDATSPRVEILNIHPAVFTPTLRGTPQTVRVKVRVTAAQLDDELHLRFTSLPDTVASLRLVDVFAGDGDYVAVCDGCSKEKIRDGLYPIEARASDRAGNVTTALDTIDKDVEPPVVRFEHPAPVILSGRTFLATQTADSLTGVARDRHGVTRVLLYFTAHAHSDSIVVQHRNAGAPDTLYAFQAAIAARASREGTYPWSLRYEDRHGLADTLDFALDVDRTPPAKPAFAPRPGRTSKSSAVRVLVRVDTADVRFVRRSGGSRPDTTRTARTPLVGFDVELRRGANLLSFTGLDRAGNASAPETTTVVWEDAFGIAAPERFAAGNVIQVSAGNHPGLGVEIGIYAMDGTLVRRFESPVPLTVYSFTWDLRTPEGRRVKNGPYLINARLRRPEGEERLRKVIAILE